MNREPDAGGPGHLTPEPLAELEELVRLRLGGAGPRVPAVDPRRRSGLEGTSRVPPCEAFGSASAHGLEPGADQVQ
jgi:hypothetical protein